MRPVKFKPIYKETLWGGTKIADFKGIHGESDRIGESWEISGVPDHESVVGEHKEPSTELLGNIVAGMSLTQLIYMMRGDLVGHRVYRQYGNQFPLLVKFIDSRRDLSVQVHPNDELAKRKHNCFGKNEMWYVLQAEQGAKIHAGLSRPITPEEYDRFVEDKSLTSVLATHDTHAGDVFYLPAGRIHAVGAGNLLVEIQQSSDVTYRIFDYDRLDANGRPRTLHTAEAREAIDYNDSIDPVNYPTSEPLNSKPFNKFSDRELVKCPYFETHLVEVKDTAEINYKVDSFIIAICIDGQGNINGTNARRGETLLIPACDNVLRIKGKATFITAMMPIRH